MPAIIWTPDDIARLAAVTTAEFQEALALWRRYAPRSSREALETAAGTPVPRAVLDPTLTAVSQEATSLAVSVQTGAAEIAYYQLQMADLVRFSQLAGAGAAVGGFQLLTVADLAIVEAARQIQLGYLVQLAQGLASGEVLPDGRFLRRSQMYIDAGRATYYDVAEQGLCAWDLTGCAACAAPAIAAVSALTWTAVNLKLATRHTSSPAAVSASPAACVMRNTSAAARAKGSCCEKQEGASPRDGGGRFRRSH